MTAKGYIRWPPACNPSDLKVHPNNFGANLTQINKGKHSNGNGKNVVRNNQKHKNGNGNHPKNQRNGVQANIREGLVPDTTLWLAEVNCSNIKQHGRSCTNKSSKMFGRRLQHKSTLNNGGVKVN